jgi:hypothetical protein
VPSGARDPSASVPSQVSVCGPAVAVGGGVVATTASSRSTWNAALIGGA